MCPNQTREQFITNHPDQTAGSLRINSDQMETELTSLAGVLGRKWNLVIIHHLLRNGPLGFSDLLGEIDDISSKVLSESLEKLEQSGFIDREIISERPFRVEYSLTTSGQTLELLINEVRARKLSVEQIPES